eukprot:GHVH01006881.1.p1 GENE.GHVH01006881.1~~GHVH01006881.1.p1  ORF type:complete len:1247 (-),score=253.27 GHVH01006881.1:3313-6948(-)
MRLQRVIIDGFKSYGQEVVVGDFAPQFNAITGLNGSGKSNILDSICYVMALKSLQQMRVGKLDDLVYKSGQAGVRKARVTLQFDNLDKVTSPPLYRMCDEITIARTVVVGGRDKYTINNKLSRPSEVHSLFHSVGLNVNNPHFLIMQGRINKVINMRQSEVMSLVEEAAGTRIYENKKKDSESRMLKKENELKEIEEIIKTEIDPQMSKLSKDRESHTQWTRLGKEITEKQKLCHYLKFMSLESLLAKTEAKKSQTVNSHKATTKALQLENSELMKLTQALDKATREGSTTEFASNLKESEVQLDKVKKTYLEKKVNYEGLLSEIERVAKLRDKNHQQKTQLLKSQSQLQTGNSDYLSKLEAMTSKLTESRCSLERKETELENLRSGTLTEVDERGEAHDLKALFSSKKKEVAQLKKDIKDHSTSVTMYQDQLKSLHSAADSEASLAALRDKVGQSEKRVQSVMAAMEQSGFDESQFEKASEELGKRKSDLKEENAKLASFLSRVRPDNTKKIITDGLDLKQIASSYYPENPAIADGVYGAVFALFHVKETVVEFSLALEQIANAKLTNCVVTDDLIAEKMFAACKKNRRSITCIPLNRIKPTQLDANLVARAKKISPHDVHSPLDLIECTVPEALKALKHVFSGYLVCRTKELARQIVKIGLNCVTMEGDTYSTSGSISGGSSAGYFDLLSQFRPLIPIVRGIEKSTEQIKLNADIVDGASERHLAYNRLRLELDKEKRTCQINANLLKAEKETSAAGDREDLIAKLDFENKELKEKKIMLESSMEQLATWETKQSASKSVIDQTIKSLSDEIPKLRSQYKKNEANLQNQKTKNTGVLKDIEEFSASIEQKDQSLRENEEKIASLSSTVEVLEKESTTWKEKVDGLQLAIKDMKSEMANSNALCASIKTDIEKTNKRLEKTTVEINNFERSIAELNSTCDDVTKRVIQTAKEHPWLKDDPNQHFADFNSATSLKAVESKLEDVKAERSNLESRFNKKVLQKVDEAEKNYNAISDRRENVLRDRDAIVEFIKELDRQKEEEVLNCQVLVNEHFNSIFSTLLPNTTAALEPVVDGNSPGLQMKVAFNGKWKSSLSELSGGQRSLLALSFILALLKYKPAPMYILDEVDAALDLSHTQNIGRLIHEHFKGSQFIIVSLKPNLFTNADVIFKTSLVQGMSQVKRLVGSDAMLEMVKHKRRGDHTKEEQENVDVR